MNVVGLRGIAARGLVGCDKDGWDLLVVWATTTFDLPTAGAPHVGTLPRSEVLVPPPAENLYAGEPGHSTLLMEAPIAYSRRGTDVHCIARAWAPAGQPTTDVQVGVRVGPCQRTAAVFGERRWTRRMSPGHPAPFVSLPLWWEHAYGGAAPGHPKRMESRNPLGRGVYATAELAIGEIMPAIEDPAHLMTSPDDRPAPAGFALLAPHWRPRADHRGTYDDAWVQTRAPLWPTDFDERFFQAAAPGLTAPGFLQGGEPVVLVGLHPDGTIAFPLPTVRLVVETELRSRRDRCVPALDLVTIDTERGVLILQWRATIPMHGELAEHHISIVRELSPEERWDP